MATRSMIATKSAEGYTAIYCHFDGCPKHQLPILTEYYDTQEKVEALIALGDISSLGRKVAPEGEQHSFYNPEADTCVAYYRDRDRATVNDVIESILDNKSEASEEIEFILDREGMKFSTMSERVAKEIQKVLEEDFADEWSSEVSEDIVLSKEHKADRFFYSGIEYVYVFENDSWIVLG